MDASLTMSSVLFPANASLQSGEQFRCPVLRQPKGILQIAVDLPLVEPTVLVLWYLVKQLSTKIYPALNTVLAEQSQVICGIWHVSPPFLRVYH
jgi:hypothetical protein